MPNHYPENFPIREKILKRVIGPFFLDLSLKCFRFILQVSVFSWCFNFWSNCSQSLTRFRWLSLYWTQFVTCFFVLNSLSHQTKPEPEETKLKIYKTSTPASTSGQLELVSPTTHKAPPRMTCTDGNFYDYWLLAFRKVCETPPKFFQITYTRLHFSFLNIVNFISRTFFIFLRNHMMSVRWD